MTDPYPNIGRELPTREVNCTKCGKLKHPKRAYLALLKSRDMRYVCQACREANPTPFVAGKLGVIA